MSSTKLARKLEQAIPSENGLYPHELVILHESKYFMIGAKPSDYPQYIARGVISDLCGINEVQPFFDDLIKRGFLKVGGVETSLEHNLAYNLKATCRNKRLKVSGTKAVLIQRLLDNVPHEELSELFPGVWYTPTAKGKKDLSDNPYIDYCVKYCINCDFKDASEAIWLMNQHPEATTETELDQLWEKSEQIARSKKKGTSYEEERQFESNIEDILSSFQTDSRIGEELPHFHLEDSTEYIEPLDLDSLCFKLKGLSLATDEEDNYIIIADDLLENYIEITNEGESGFNIELHDYQDADPSVLKFQKASLPAAHDMITFEILMDVVTHYLLSDIDSCKTVDWIKLQEQKS